VKNLAHSASLQLLDKIAPSKFGIKQSGSPWRDCPAEYGPYTTIYNRFNRWSRQGVWSEIFYALTGKSDVVTGAIDATYIKVHRSAGGAKGGPSTTPSEPRAADERPKSTR
jgi:hypothetical protein